MKIYDKEISLEKNEGFTLKFVINGVKLAGMVESVEDKKIVLDAYYEGKLEEGSDDDWTLRSLHSPNKKIKITIEEE